MNDICQCGKHEELVCSEDCKCRCHALRAQVEELRAQLDKKDGPHPWAIVHRDPQSRGRWLLHLGDVFIDDAHESPVMVDGRPPAHLVELAEKLNSCLRRCSMIPIRDGIRPLLDALFATGGAGSDAARTLANAYGIDMSKPPEISLDIHRELDVTIGMLAPDGLPTRVRVISASGMPFQRRRQGDRFTVTFEVIEGEPARKGSDITVEARALTANELRRLHGYDDHPELLPLEPEEHLVHVMPNGIAMCTTGEHGPRVGWAWVDIPRWRDATCSICRYRAAEAASASRVQLEHLEQFAIRQLERRSPPPIRFPAAMTNLPDSVAHIRANAEADAVIAGRPTLTCRVCNCIHVGVPCSGPPPTTVPGPGRPTNG